MKDQDKAVCVYRYANRFRCRAEAAGKGNAYPTIRQTARALRMRQADVEQSVDDAKDRGFPIDMAVGVQIGGGGGHGLFDTVGDYQIETWSP